MKFWIIVLPLCSILNFFPVVELIFLVRILGLHHNHTLTCFPNLLTNFFFFLFWSNWFQDDHQGSVSTSSVAWPKSECALVYMFEVMFVL